MVGVWEGLNLGSIPNFFLCFGMHPKIIDVYPKLIPKGGVVQFCPSPPLNGKCQNSIFFLTTSILVRPTRHPIFANTVQPHWRSDTSCIVQYSPVQSSSPVQPSSAQHSQDQYTEVLHYLALSCTILHSIALSGSILHYLALSCNILHYFALSCTLLHYLALSCTILLYLAHKVFI